MFNRCKLCNKICFLGTTSSGYCKDCEESKKRWKAKEELKKQANARELEIIMSIPAAPVGTDGKKQPLRKISDLQSVTYSGVTARSNRNRLGNFIAIDIETCGLKATDPVVEVSAIKFSNYDAVSSYTTLINPGKPIPEEAIAVHHITDEMVQNAPFIWQVIPSLNVFVENLPLIGHNLPFDLKFLYRHGFEVGGRTLYDTLALAHKVIKKSEVEDYTLLSCCMYYCISLPSAHRSTVDAYAAGKLFEQLVQDCT